MRKFIRTPFAIALLIGLLCALSGGADPLNHMYWNIRFKFGGQNVPNSIVVISEQVPTVDGANGQWASQDQSRLIEIIRRQVPQRVFFDAALVPGDEHAIDGKFSEVVRQFGDDFSIVLHAGNGDQSTFGSPLLDDGRLHGTQRVISAWKTNFLGYATSSATEFVRNGKVYKAFASALARDPRQGKRIYAAAEFDPESVPVLDARHVLNNQFAPGLLTGRTVVVTQARGASQAIGYHGHGRVDPTLVDVTAAYGFRRPFSASWGPWFPLLLASTLLLVAQRSEKFRWRIAFAFLAALAPIALPIPLQLIGITTTPADAFVMLAVYASVNLWHRWRSRFRHTSTSGLPNLVALSERKIDPGHDVVVAVIARYEEFLATLPTEQHGECAQQIARRLAVGSGSAQIYHGEGGQFAWTEEARALDTQFDHLDGLKALFSAPLRIGDHTFDTNVHFGLDRNGALDAHTRVNSALASATEALTHGRTTESFEAARLADASWDLSLHSRIDDGLRNGEIWLAFQPQWDFRVNRISGAEALIRWNHPERGPIKPDEFILQAERAGRIDTLTYWVIEQAISAHAALSVGDPLFQMSINLSGQMVDKPSLVSNFSEIVRRRGIDARRLTVEVTETSGVQNRPAARHNLSQLRAMGFRLSIDDFGTGEASLSYLAELPSDELKLDRRFVSAITTCSRNRTIVGSTIGLAHALGQVVVAEGIEDEETFHMLRAMDCDHAQGYWIGRPVPLAELVSRCSETGRSISAAFRDC
ncbi:EAL domain-containing protein [Novosphingobium sp.]|uniref:EAL domain-containing protein n=1 Tax=Novosphingobium sp. TaxID=1874826 RepID=UPI0025EECA40|nr:EAL domain-containing protein [Novosphingobium sp.]